MGRYMFNIDRMRSAIIILTFLALFGSLAHGCCKEGEKNNCGNNNNIHVVVKTTTKKPWSWWGRNGLEKNDLENDYEDDLKKNGLEKTLINDETVESMAFEICNTDGVDGLSWAEVEQCEELYCQHFTFDCPTRSDFDFFDADKDGVLTWSEWESLHE